jgi:NADH dehydrogenase
VVSAGPLRLSGFAGWVVWLFIHIGFLTGYRNRIGAILTWWLAFTLDSRRERAYTTRAIGMVRDLYQPLGSDPEDAAAAGPTPAGEARAARPPAQRPAPQARERRP